MKDTGIVNLLNNNTICFSCFEINPQPIYFCCFHGVTREIWQDLVVCISPLLKLFTIHGRLSKQKFGNHFICRRTSCLFK